MNYSFIGLGMMAEAIIRGMAKSLPAKIYGYDTSPARYKALEGLVVPCETAEQAVKSAEAVVFAVKPNVLASVLESLRGVFTPDKLLVSIAAGKSTDFIREHSGAERIVRVMPNLGATVMAGSAAVCAAPGASEADVAAVREVFEAVGSVVEISEGLIPVFSGVASCSPAFTFEYIDALALAGVRGGMKYADALRAAASAVMGSAKLVLESADHPSALRDRVCSPGGTTIEGVAELKERGFEAAVIAAVEATVEKDKLL